VFDTGKTYDTPRDRGGIVALSFAPGNGKMKRKCAGVPAYNDTERKQREGKVFD
jgi:hypothetical protein